MAGQTIVFVSYARQDEQYATALMRRLAQEPDIAPWQDRISMAPGDFEDQIKRGIESAQYLVLVMTPGALRSRWVEQEWRYAREQGVCICPIKPAFDSPSVDKEVDELRAGLPSWMQKIQTYDFDAYWRRFVQVLLSPCQATRTPFLAADLPPAVVPRPDEYRKLIDAVLTPGLKDPSGRTVVLHGSGGFGKTTLALGVCHDPDVFAACDGGILWATLGANPAVAGEIERVYAALTGERPGFASVEDGMFELGRKLEGKRCLFVIDDVWDVEHLKPFLHGGRACSRLITTRRFDIAVRAAPDEGLRINVGELQPDEAEHVLSAGLGVSAADLAELDWLADRLGRQPLLLRLANRTLVEQVARGQPLAEAIEWSRQRYAETGIAAFDRDRSVARTVELSLGFLTAEERERCLELGIFPEDTDVPFTVLRAVWRSGSDAAAQALAQRLHDLALVNLSLRSRSIQMHDMMREYFRSHLADPAPLHARLADEWSEPRRVPGGYGVRHAPYHLAESMADPSQAVPRGRQLIALLTDGRYSDYQRRFGDPAALDRQLRAAMARMASSGDPEAPALLAALALLRRSNAQRQADPERIFDALANGRVAEADERLRMFGTEREWETLARLLIAWLAPPGRGEEARALLEAAARGCDRPALRMALAWVRHAPDGIPPDLSPVSGIPAAEYIAALLQRAGGAEAIEGLEPIDPASGTDSSGFIAERDGPDLVAFAYADPAAHTPYLERYIAIHAANRYAYYRRRSLWALVLPVLQFPDAHWVRRILRQLVTAALSATSVEFEEFLPLAVRGVLAAGGDAPAMAALEDATARLKTDAARLQSGAADTDWWSAYQRRAAALAEIVAVALGRSDDAAGLLQLARDLPKGFAGFRARSALMLAESTAVAAPSAAAHVDAALLSARAAAHRIQEYRFCLQTTAMVNAMRARWWNPAVDVGAAAERFVADPTSEEFCAVHVVGEDFEFRSDGQLQALPIPPDVRGARTLRRIAAAFDLPPDRLLEFNRWIWAEPGCELDEPLLQDSDVSGPDRKLVEVNVPDPEFVPMLAARLAAGLLASDLPRDRRQLLLQRLVLLAFPNRTALDTVLARLLLSMAGQAAALPDLLVRLEVPAPDTGAGGIEASMA